jgi:benzoyl-CoA reductase/2-hydroxyglutaryl-CoA dehydratase subunit BcrC/BadD/HgdB
MRDKSKVLQEFWDISQSISNDSINALKESGGKVVGYSYSYIPEELIMAAGATPFRVRATGTEETSLSAPYYTDINCGVVRYLFNSVLENKYDFLDGFVSSNICDQMRRTYDNWATLENNPCCGFVYIPKARTDNGFDNYFCSLKELKASLEEQLGVTITDEAINDAIAQKNEVRRLQRKLYDFMKEEKPALSGADVHAAMVAGASIPQEEYAEKLAILIEELEGKEGEEKPQARFILTTGELDNPKLIETIESQGGAVVASSMLYGLLSCQNDIPEGTDDPLKTLAEHYFYSDPTFCPRIMGTAEQRKTYVTDLVEEFNADGVITYSTPFCEQWEFEQVFMNDYLDKAGVAHLALDCDYLLSGEGQIKTRVQAFQETIQGGKE